MKTAMRICVILLAVMVPSLASAKGEKSKSEEIRLAIIRTVLADDSTTDETSELKKPVGNACDYMLSLSGCPAFVDSFLKRDIGIYVGAVIGTEVSVEYRKKFLGMQVRSRNTRMALGKDMERDFVGVRIERRCHTIPSCFGFSD